MCPLSTSLILDEDFVSPFEQLPQPQVFFSVCLLVIINSSYFQSAFPLFTSSLNAAVPNIPFRRGNFRKSYASLGVPRLKTCSPSSRRVPLKKPFPSFPFARFAFQKLFPLLFRAFLLKNRFRLPFSVEFLKLQNGGAQTVPVEIIAEIHRLRRAPRIISLPPRCRVLFTAAFRPLKSLLPLPLPPFAPLRRRIYEMTETIPSFVGYRELSPKFIDFAARRGLYYSNIK